MKFPTAFLYNLYDTEERLEIFKGDIYMSEKLLKLDLQLFAEGEASGENSQDAAVSTESEQNHPQSSPEERKAQYAKFKEDFKDEYNAEVQGLVKDRLKKSNERLNAAKEFKSKSDKVFEALSVMYGLDADDYDGISRAVENDNSFYEQKAMEANMDVNEYRKLQQMKRENEQLRRQNEDYIRQQQMEQKYRTWIQQGQQTKEIYPNFDINAESQNPDFMRLLNSGVDVTTAFEVVHKNDILTAGMRYAANQTAAKMQQNANANANRPSENGISEHAASSSKIDVNKISDDQLVELIRRAKAGERITFQS